LAQQPTLNNFLGLAPNRTAFSGQAFVAENVDLSGGGLTPVKAPSLIESGHSGEFIKHLGVWISGGRNYLSADIQGLDSIIYKTPAGDWKIRIMGGAEADLWIPAPTGFSVTSSELSTPATPRLLNMGAGNIPAETYEYFITWAVMDGDKVLRESDSSGATPITIDTPSKVRITRPSINNIPDTGAVWRVYRRIKGSALASLVITKGIWDTIALDDKDLGDLGESIYPEQRSVDGYQYKYVIVWVRNINGWITESTPSEIFSVSQSSEGTLVSRRDEDTPPQNATHWRIYRLSIGRDPTTTFQLVKELAVAETRYTDVLDNVELGEALQSSYRADNGALVSAGIPDVQFDGMAGPFNGFYVGWSGNDLYLSEPGNPSWWPGAFVVQANYKITGISQVGGNIAVVTEGGVQFGYGVSPDAFALSQAVFGIGGVNRRAISRNVYLSHNGIYAINESGVEELTKDFPKEYFDSLVVTGLIYELDKIILFHEQGALMLEGGQWTTLAQRDHSFTAAYATGGFIYGLRDGSILKLFGSDESATMDYESTVDFSEGYTKRIEAVRVRGSGDVRVELKAIEDTDQILTAGDVNLDSNYWPDKTVYTPSWLDTEAIRYRVAGKATVRGIIFEVDKGSTET
jgi:hypothetical protein